MAKPKVRNYWAYFCLNSITPLLYYLAHIFPELDLAGGIKILAALLIGLFLTGIFITWLSTFFASSHFLNLKTDELY